MSEPDNPRWLEDVGDELRRDVPVRPPWRARLLDQVARAERPVEGSDFDDRLDELESATSEPSRRMRRRIVLHPLTGVAAATLFVALGAAAMFATLTWRTRANDPTSVASAPNGATQVVTASSTDREVVHFELAAPSASRVTLVGSFNEWNPVATPLERDTATGKWVVAVRLAPGRHVYAFVVDGDVTADPDAPRAADDDFGSANSVVLVSSPRT